jgi:hypothetical protein
MGGLWKGAGARTLRTMVLVGLLVPAAAHRTVPRLGRGGGALPFNGLKVLKVLRDSRNTHPRQPLTRLCHFCALRGGGTEARDELRGEPRPDGPAWRARFPCSARARAIPRRPSFVTFLSACSVAGAQARACKDRQTAQGVSRQGGPARRQRMGLPRGPPGAGRRAGAPRSARRCPQSWPWSRGGGQRPQRRGGGDEAIVAEPGHPQEEEGRLATSR